MFIGKTGFVSSKKMKSFLVCSSTLEKIVRDFCWEICNLEYIHWDGRTSRFNEGASTSV